MHTFFIVCALTPIDAPSLLPMIDNANAALRPLAVCVVLTRWLSVRLAVAMDQATLLAPRQVLGCS